MSTSSAPKRKPLYDPARQWGLKPTDSDSGGATYIVSGHIVNGSKLDSRSLYAIESIGREGQAKAKRKLSGKDADRALKNLLERDKEGMRAVMKAREAGTQTGNSRKGEKNDKGKGKETKPLVEAHEDRERPAMESDNATTTKNRYSAQVIKHLGFNPITKAGQQRGGG